MAYTAWLGRLLVFLLAGAAATAPRKALLPGRT